MPTVRLVILAAASFGSIVYHSSASTKTGVAPAKQIASIVGNAVCEGASTSSPALTPRPFISIQSAAVAELVSTACLTPVWRASSTSRSLHLGAGGYVPAPPAAGTGCFRGCWRGGQEGR